MTELTQRLPFPFVSGRLDTYVPRIRGSKGVPQPLDLLLPLRRQAVDFFGILEVPLPWNSDSPVWRIPKARNLFLYVRELLSRVTPNVDLQKVAKVRHLMAEVCWLVECEATPSAVSPQLATVPLAGSHSLLQICLLPPYNLPQIRLLVSLSSVQISPLASNSSPQIHSLIPHSSLPLLLFTGAERSSRGS